MQISEGVLGGVFSLPFNAAKKLTIEYTMGQTIVLEGAALQVWWSEQLKMMQTLHAMSNVSPIISSEMFREDKDVDEKEDSEDDNE